MDFRTMAAIVAGVVVLGCLALWLGRGLRIRKGPDGVSFETSAAAEAPRGSQVSVGQDLRIEQAVVGDISGQGEEALQGGVQVDVLKNAVIRGSRVGNISGGRVPTKNK